MSENEETLENQRQRRICFLIFLSFILLSVLGLQLWNTQVLHGHDYEDKAKMQSLRKIRIPHSSPQACARLSGQNRHLQSLPSTLSPI